MAARSIGSGSISFGLVTIPVKLYTATQAQHVHFNMLDPTTKQRVKQQYIVPATGDVIDMGSCVRGYEHTKDKFVVFTPEEMKSLAEPSNGGVFEIKEFVPAESVDLLYVEKSMYVGPNKGGDKSYALLATALVKEGKYAVAQWISRGKQHLIVIRPYKDGLIAHQMFYVDEVRSFDASVDVAKLPITDAEVNMACQLIRSLSSPAFDVSSYEDKHRRVVLDAIEKKVNGDTYTAPVVNASPTLELFEALKASLAAQGVAVEERPVAARGPDVKDACLEVERAVKASSEAITATDAAVARSTKKPFKGRGYGREALVRLVQALADDKDKAARAFGKPADVLAQIVEWEKSEGKLKDVAP